MHLTRCSTEGRGEREDAVSARRDDAIRPATVDDVAERIARDIQSGVFAPGAWLKQVVLEQRYGRPRIDVRRALDRLADKRIVVHEPNRGYRVYEPDGEWAAQTRDIRLALELWAADSIVLRAQSADIDRLRELAARFDALILDGTVIELYEANLAFHQALLELGGNRELVLLVADLRSRTSSAPAGQWHTRRRIEQSSREHFAIVEAISRRDGPLLRELISAHILQTG